ncbi:MAG: nucleotidyl transferase AbiEii/AbiGii toxin family protein [Acidimicrobiales bacterium]
MITRGIVTQRANDEQLPAQTIERDYILANVCADVGALGDARLVFKGGTLLRLCYFDDYRYSADLDFSAIDGLNSADAVAIVATAVEACRRRIEAPTLEVSDADDGTAWVSYVGPLGARPRKIKLDISDDELVESHERLRLYPRWPDLPDSAAIEGYSLYEVGAEKLRCIAERLQCRDLYDLHELLDGKHIDAMETWHLYLRKAANDVTRGRQRTPSREWASAFERRLAACRERWEQELGDYLSDVPAFGDVERRLRRHLSSVIEAAQALADQ